MASNYDNEYGADEGFQAPSEELPAWNTWTTRAALKSLSGLFLAIPVLAIILSMLSPLSLIGSDMALVNFTIGLVIWGVFYQMEREYRRVTPNRFR